MANRGLIKKNYFADLVLWDPDKIEGVSSFKKPKVKPQGIIKVWVNGKDTSRTEQNRLPGRLLLRGKS
ncbi:hypothetical protein J7L67_09695 [bacterium]|nr:hypothetical protein [bacterium]